MAETSRIEWTDATWTPIRARCFELQNDGSGKERIGWHCEHVSPGCANCYAESINRRLGTGFAFKPGNLRGKRGTFGGGPDRPEVFLDETMLMAPLRWKRPRMIFVCSMTDLFADFVPDEWIDRVFAVMALCPQHTFQLLTKRSARMRDYMTRRAGDGAEAVRVMLTAHHAPSGKWCERLTWPLPNVWLGVSAEDQRRADERVPDLLATPAAVRFVSAEPLLGQIDFTNLKPPASMIPDGVHGWSAIWRGNAIGRPAVDWIIAGGESGPGARPMHPDWARKIRDDCAAEGVAFHFKQWGAWAPDTIIDRIGDEVDGCQCGEFHSGKHWVPGCMCSEGDPDMPMFRVGKKHAGRLLDGRTHDDMPGASARGAEARGDDREGQS